MDPNACTVFAGPDQCLRVAGHRGQHTVVWGGGVTMRWDGDESWSHDLKPHDSQEER